MSDVYALNNLHNALKPLKSDPGNTGVFSDLDGTLSKIARTPADAAITPSMRDVLRRLTEKYGIFGIVSGRDSSEAKKIIDIDNVAYIGNHGLEWIENGKQFYTPEASNFFGLAASLEADLIELFKKTDVFIEKKKLGVALHYRSAKDKEGARGLIEKMIKPIVAEYPLRRLDGRYVIELKPDLPINKGDAITVIAMSRGLNNAVYLGDDITDIDAFNALRTLRDESNLRTISVGVASDESPPQVEEEADYVIKSVDEVEALLSWMVE
ncbi:MAG TPA: trehalose-phosphatase [Anaerolineae bacterium]|nr:trehalose-phosphatase [Anaerolineae bacterium]